MKRYEKNAVGLNIVDWWDLGLWEKMGLFF